ncbi:ThuA domain-containing protein [uncultured Paraglaciecola sp.]|uniref:ThuA domain-containing protein n=1 Tax=uncultured Paraglaciecola sp. TaxID=1765024 RepID=UPI0030D793B1|tara:strand:+ start:14827 stop:15594 length:768 start_codon:yes stop_codon:yes gene_type:complete
MKSATIILCASLLITTSLAHAEQFNLLLFTKTVEWHHKSINGAVQAIETLGIKHHFGVDWQEDAALINDDNLKNYDAVVFLLTSGDILNSQQEAALQRFIQSGKGFVGIHSASDTEKTWPWYNQLVGHVFKIHPEIQTAQMEVVSRDFPGMEYLPNALLWTDEWYEFGPAQSKNLNYLLTVDENTFAPHAQWGDNIGDGMGKFHPIAWYHTFDGGRAFYTALGHKPIAYQDNAFLQHIYGGIYWAATGKGIPAIQ